MRSDKREDLVEPSSPEPEPGRRQPFEILTTLVHETPGIPNRCSARLPFGHAHSKALEKSLAALRV